MTSRIQAITSGIVSAITTFIAWLATVPPQQQTDMLGVFLEAFPYEWRAPLGAWCKIIATLSGIYATVKAAQSGPAQPPTPPNENLPQTPK